MRRSAAVLLLAAALFTSRTIKPDETVVVVDTAAHLDGDEWVVPLHAWIFEREHSIVRKTAIAKALKHEYGLAPSEKTAATFDERVQWLLVDDERGKVLTATVAGKTVTFPRTHKNGHTTTELRLPAGDVTPGKPLPVTIRQGERSFQGEVRVPTGDFLVISDIDDTIKVTDVTDRAKMMDRTFFQPFEAVPGMAETYRQWASEGASFHFVSSSPWQLYVPLRDFIRDADFPPATFHLKYVRATDKTLFNLFEPATETKPPQIERILKANTSTSVVLVGDSGEQDPEIYAALYTEYPKQIKRIYIRNVTGAAEDDERFTNALKKVPKDVWKLFTDPSDLMPPPAQ